MIFCIIFCVSLSNAENEKQRVMALGMAAIRDGVVIFESDPRGRADFEEEAMKRYLDYLPLKREYEEATFSAFS